MSSKLTSLASSISASSPNIRNFALQAALEINQLQLDLAALTVTTAPPVNTPPPSTAWALKPPVPPITTVSSPAGVGLNVNSVVAQTYQDYVIDNTTDSAVLLQNATHGCTFHRFHITRVDAQVPSKPYGVHGVYCKAPGNMFTDFFVDGSGGGQRLGAAFSVRMGDNVFYNTVVQQMPFGVSYFEYDHIVRSNPVTFINGKWACTNTDTCVWMDEDSGDGGSTQVIQPFHFENIEATGGNYFLKISPGKYVGTSVVIKNCTLNGKPVTAAQVSGVPLSALHVT